ncbi:hypothetical protein NDU88_002602 [Pleurodeles waltl]|uniref:COMM domain-containing protein n=1 Tax=Pleurodeles waltl TaxID=8319 RepID=A0AAV7WQ06_PLEWA|nr:hypothetical protein NDU88_002602 [Pleurodeles waltl]
MVKNNERASAEQEAHLSAVIDSQATLHIVQQLEKVSKKHQDTIIKCVKSRKEEIRHALLERVTAMSSAQLQDFDWQLKLALSSDKISALQMPLVNLDLDVRENNEIKSVSIEMNKEELQSLISSLEAANKVVLQLK